jgi:hypothetical protein
MLAELGHACADYADERFPIQTRSSLSDANTLLPSLNKNYATKTMQPFEKAHETCLTMGYFFFEKPKSERLGLLQ